MSGSRNETARPRYFQNRIFLFCLPISTFMYCICKGFIYIPRIGLPIWLQQITHEYRNWKWGRAVFLLGIHKSDLRYSANLRKIAFKNIIQHSLWRENYHNVNYLLICSVTLLQHAVAHLCCTQRLYSWSYWTRSLQYIMKTILCEIRIKIEVCN